MPDTIIGTSTGEQFESDAHFQLSQIPGGNKFLSLQNAGPDESQEPAHPLKITIHPSHPDEGPKPTQTFDASSGLGSDESFDYGTVDNVVNKLKQTWPAKAIDSLVDAFKLPGDVYHGDVDLNSPAGSARATDMALNLMGGGLATAPEREAGVGIFGGKLGAARVGKTEALDTAESMTGAGMHPRDVHAETGAFMGPDDQMRFEIGDQGSKMWPQSLAETDMSKEAQAKWATVQGQPQAGWMFPNGQPNPRYGIKFPETGPKQLKLEDVLHHPELYNAYPELRDYKVTPAHWTHAMEGVRGTFNSVDKRITLTPNTESEMRSTLLHEVQHAVQDIEGHAQGGNSAQWLPRNDEFKQLGSKFKEADSALDKMWENKVRTGFEKEFHGTSDWATFKPTKYTVNHIIEREAQGAKISPKDQKILNYMKENHPDYVDLRHTLKEANDVIEQAKNKAYTDYTKIFGEAEARTVQERMHMLKSERNAMFPLDSNTMKQAYPDMAIDEKYINAKGFNYGPPGEAESTSEVQSMEKPTPANDNGQMMSDAQHEYSRLYADQAKPKLKIVESDLSKIEPKQAAQRYRDLRDSGNSKAAWKFEDDWTAIHGRDAWAEGDVALFKDIINKPINILDRDKFSIQNLLGAYAKGQTTAKDINNLLKEKEWTLGSKGLEGNEVELFDPLGHPHWLTK